MGRGIELPWLSGQGTFLVLPHVHQPGSSLNPVLLGSFVEASSLRHDQSLTQFPVPLLFPEDGGWDRKFQTSNHGLNLFGDQPPSWSYPWAHQESPHYNKRHPYYLGNSKGLRSSVSGIRVKDQIFGQKMFLVLLSVRILLGF